MDVTQHPIRGQITDISIICETHTNTTPNKRQRWNKHKVKVEKTTLYLSYTYFSFAFSTTELFNLFFNICFVNFTALEVSKRWDCNFPLLFLRHYSPSSFSFFVRPLYLCELSKRFQFFASRTQDISYNESYLSWSWKLFFYICQCFHRKVL